MTKHPKSLSKGLFCLWLAAGCVPEVTVTQTSSDADTGGIAGSNAASGSTAGTHATAGDGHLGGGAAGAPIDASAGNPTSAAAGSSALVGGAAAIGGAGVTSSAGKVGQAGSTQIIPVTGGASFAGSAPIGGVSATSGGLGSYTGGSATGGLGSSTGGSSTGGSVSSTGGAFTATGGAPIGIGGTTSAAGRSTAGTAGALNFAGSSSACTGTLALPTNPIATDGTDDTRIALRWAAAPCAETYEIYRATASDGTYAMLGSTGLTVFDDANNLDTIPYYYKLRSHSTSQGYSDYTAPFKGSRKQGYVLDASWGSSGTGDGQFASAYGIATDSSNNVYILDTYNHRVQKFDSTGALQTKWGGITLSGENGKFYYPKAISIANDVVYVGDDGGSMQKFTATGTYVSSFEIGSATSLMDVDLDASGNLFIAQDLWASSTQSLLIAKINADFTLQTVFGGAGEADGQFSREMHLAVDATRALVYVSDAGHSKVHLFTLSGTYVNAWGTSGTGPMQFDGPAGIAVDPSGDVYVADEGNDRLSKFTVTNGTATLAATWSAPQCHAITIDTNGRVVVMATNNAKVLIYRRR